MRVFFTIIFAVYAAFLIRHNNKSYHLLVYWGVLEHFNFNYLCYLRTRKILQDSIDIYKSLICIESQIKYIRIGM